MVWLVGGWLDTSNCASWSLGIGGQLPGSFSYPMAVQSLRVRFEQREIAAISSDRHANSGSKVRDLVR